MHHHKPRKYEHACKKYPHYEATKEAMGNELSELHRKPGKKATEEIEVGKMMDPEGATRA